MSGMESLSYAARPQVVGKYLGQLLFLLGGFSVPPLLFAAALGDWPHAAGYAVAALALITIGWLLQRLSAADDLQTNEALIVVSAIFICAPLAMALPMMTKGVSVLDALFEAVSGITTTGLSTFARIEDKPLSVVFAAAWLQWLGGIGIIVLSFALLVGQSASAKRLTGILAQPQGVWGGTRAYAKVIIRIYVALTMIGIVVLWLAGASWFSAVTLALSAVSTGGFSPFDDSLGGLSATIQTVVILLCLAGAASIPLFYDLWRGRWKDVLLDSELQALLIAGVVVAGVLLVASAAAAGGGQGTWSLIFTAFSAQTTAGFSTMNVGELDPFSKVVLVIAMASGGCVGSSAGGIKLLRLIVMIRLVQLMILKTRLTPRAATEPRIAGRHWADDELVAVLTVAGLFIVVVLLSWLPFLLAGYGPLDALFEVTSATGTVGLSSGITGPALSPWLKALLCLDMLLGRLEILPILVLLAPRTWIGPRRELQSVREQ
jgi:trk system potassium uptake protein TrkH